MRPVSLQDLVRSSRNPKGYVRVSTDDQNPDLQYAALAAIGLEKSQIIYDIESGTHTKRFGYQEICSAVLAGTTDFVAVNRIDRLGRDHYELVSFLHILEDSGCKLISVCEPFVQHWRESAWAFRATWDAIGDARYELLRLKERQRQGIDAAQEAIRRGLRTKTMGRPRRKMGISSNP
jgi:DNA invertase Pin-like site-specific DNA recombinase